MWHFLKNRDEQKLTDIMKIVYPEMNPNEIKEMLKTCKKVDVNFHWVPCNNLS